MTLSQSNLFKSLLLLAIAFTFTNCEKDDDKGTQVQGTVAFEITDAPIDNSNIKGSFVTVTAVKVDGQVISNFNGKQTIDLMAYQNGDTKALGIAELETGTYTDVSLVLDYETDADGNMPGCYILTNDDTKHNLNSEANASNEIKINNKAFTVSENTQSKIVLDFDVRKAIKKEDNPSSDDEYDFVTTAELNASVRLVDKDASAKISGKVTDNLGMTDDRVVVFAYAKGDFDKDVEVQGQGASDITFKNAVSSCIVQSDGSYNLSFLADGEYELHFVNYKEESNGEMKINGMIQATTTLSLDILGINLDASTDVILDVTVVSVNPI